MSKIAVIGGTGMNTWPGLEIVRRLESIRLSTTLLLL